MKDMERLVAVMFYALAKLCRFNAFASLVVGFVYSQLAGWLDRQFIGLGSTQIMLLGAVLFVVFGVLSIGFTLYGDRLWADADEVGSGA